MFVKLFSKFVKPDTNEEIDVVDTTTQGLKTTPVDNLVPLLYETSSSISLPTTNIAFMLTRGKRNITLLVWAKSASGTGSITITPYYNDIAEWSSNETAAIAASSGTTLSLPDTSNYYSTVIPITVYAPYMSVKITGTGVSSVYIRVVAYAF